MEIFNKVIEVVANNYQWLFSGLGIVVFGLIVKKNFTSVNKVKQTKIKALGDVVGRDKN